MLCKTKSIVKKAFSSSLLCFLDAIFVLLILIFFTFSFLKEKKKVFPCNYLNVNKLL